MVANRRAVVTIGLVSVLRVSKVPTVIWIEGVVVAKRRIALPLKLAFGCRVSTVPTVTVIGGSWLQNAELWSLLDLRRVFASQKCQQSHGSEGGERGESREKRREERRDER